LPDVLLKLFRRDWPRALAQRPQLIEALGQALGWLGCQRYAHCRQCDSERPRFQGLATRQLHRFLGPSL